jgi:hypothetical protein
MRRGLHWTEVAIRFCDENKGVVEFILPLSYIGLYITVTRHINEQQTTQLSQHIQCRL